MKEEYKIFSIFPTAGYGVKIPENVLSPSIKDLLDKEPLRQEPKDRPLSHGLRSKDGYLLNNLKYKILSDYILDHVTNFAENILLLDYKTYKFTQSWTSIKPPQSSHSPHTHPFSLISGVLFYGDKGDYPPLIFTKSPKEAVEKLSHKTKQNVKPNKYTTLEFTVDYSPNLLVLFPSNLQHLVGTNNNPRPRKSLAFNVVPRDGLGDEYTSTELKFN